MLRRDEVEQFGRRLTAFEHYCVAQQQGGRAGPGTEFAATLAQLSTLRNTLNDMLGRLVLDDRSLFKGWLLKRKDRPGKLSRWRPRYWSGAWLCARLAHEPAAQRAVPRRSALLRAAACPRARVRAAATPSHALSRRRHLDSQDMAGVTWGPNRESLFLQLRGGSAYEFKADSTSALVMWFSKLGQIRPEGFSLVRAHPPPQRVRRF